MKNMKNMKNMKILFTKEDQEHQYLSGTKL
jgi:hypothetical protein